MSQIVKHLDYLEYILDSGERFKLDLDQESFLSTANCNSIRGAAGNYLRCRGKAFHRDLLNPPVGMEVDHINGDTTDNRRTNLRICTVSQNRQNSAVRKDSKSRSKGVFFRDEYRNPWVARIWVPELKTTKHVGRFLTKEEAEIAYRSAAIRQYGQYARV